MFREAWRLASQKTRLVFKKEDLDKAHERALVAEEVRTFFGEHPVGKYILEKAKRDRQHILEKLAKVNPNKPDDIYALQNKLLAIELLDIYIAEAKVEFNKAKATLEQAARTN